MGRDLGFITRFWMSMTKFFDIMNSFMITEINKTQWFYQWICDTQIMWKLFYVILLRIIVLSSFTAQKMKFSTKDFFSKCDQIRNGKLRFCAVFEHWIMLIVFIYLVLILSVWLTIKPNNLRNFILEFLKKKHDQTFIFVQGVLWLSQQSMPVSPSVCDTFFSRFTQWIFSIFWMRIFCHIKVANPDFGKLDLWSR